MLHKDRVFQEIGNMLGKVVTQDDPDWFRHRMQAMARVIKNMTPEEIRDLDAKKKELSENGFPEEERPR